MAFTGKRTPVRGRFVVMLGLACGLAAVPGLGAAQVATPPRSISVIFLESPTKLLTDNPDGGARLVAQVRELVVSDPATLQAILRLIASASKDQKSAIGTGLAQAARATERTNAALAEQIQTGIVLSGDQDVRVAYTAGTGQPTTTATGGAGAPGGGIGGQTNALAGGPAGTGGASAINGGSSPTFPFATSSNVVATSGLSYQSVPTGGTATTDIAGVSGPSSP